MMMDDNKEEKATLIIGESSSSNNNNKSYYLSLIPRGFEHVVSEILLEKLSSPPQYKIRIEYVGEKQQKQESNYSFIRSLKEKIIIKRNNDIEKKRRLQERQDGAAVEDPTCKQPVGTADHYGHHVSLGYHSCRAVAGQQQRRRQQQDEHEGITTITKDVWTVPGQLQGLVWMKIVTTAPVELITKHLRCLGPLLALVDVWEDDCNDNNNDNNVNVVDLTESRSLDDTVNEIRRLISKRSATCYKDSLDTSLTLWMKCVKCSWNYCLSQPQIDLLEEKIAGNMPLRYRLSCIRDESKKYQYSRQELLASIADIIVPSPYNNNNNNNNANNNETKMMAATEKQPTKQQHKQQEWIVDLKNYDLEIVILIRQHSLGIGLAIRPYQHVGAKSFSTGIPPPDITPPYLKGNVLDGGLIKLRPSTSQILLHIAHLKPGDIVLDPCAGVGTIPIETSAFYSDNTKSAVIAFGGDLVLTPDGLGPIAASYLHQAQIVLTSSNNTPGSPPPAHVPDLMGWDACNIPIRSNSIDVIISDLPFGQKCLSTAKLETMIPLLLSEMSRVLRHDSDSNSRMVLLCGSYIPILEALITANNDTAGIVWELPCQSIFPVNIGGLLAWVICIKRGNGPVPAFQTKAHMERVKKLTTKREVKLKHQQNQSKTNSAGGAAAGKSRKRIQS